MYDAIRMQKTEELIARILKEYQEYQTSHNGEPPDYIYVSTEEYYFLLRYRIKNNPVRIKVSEMGITFVTCFDIPIKIKY